MRTTLYRGRSPSQKVTVTSLASKPGQGAGVKTIFAPWESHPDWSNLTGSNSPTVFYRGAELVEITEPIPPGAWHALMNTAIGMVDDCVMSCKMGYVGNVDYGTYMMAKGTSENNFVGVTSYNDKISLYDKINDSWIQLGVSVSNAGTLDKEVKISIVGDQITLFVDGVEIGTATTNVGATGYVGTMLRDHPARGTLFYDLSIEARNIGEEKLIVPCDRSGWVISESSLVMASYPGSKAFNCSTINGGDAWVSAAELPPQWVEANQNNTTKYRITRLSLKGRTVIADDHMDDRRPDPLVLMGSDNGVDWVEIYRWTGTGPWNAGQEKEFICPVSTAYRHFRVVWEDYGDAGSSVGTQMGWIKIFGYDVTTAVTYNGNPVTYFGSEVTYGY